MARQPTPIAEILADLMARRGFGRVQSTESLEKAWRQAVSLLEAGPLMAEHTQVGKLARGRLEVIVDHSTLLQELQFQKAALLRSLKEQLPDEGIKDLRFRVGTVQ